MSIADKLITVADNVQKVYDAGYAAGQAAGGGGGGSVDGYATVTFMNGGEVLFSRMVLAGDDCPDPYVQNRIELPTKESTVQYDYTFNGWATADGGSANSNALKGITEDKTLYAAYKGTVRSYTVTYYDDDGVTVLHTEQLAYGSMPSYAPTKEGAAFDGWTPSLAPVTGDASYVVTWSSVVDGGTCGDTAYWSLDANNVLKIYGTGRLSSHPWTDNYKAQIQAAIVEEGITYLAGHTFSGCTALKSVTIASTVAEMASYCFYNCKNIESVYIGDLGAWLMCNADSSLYQYSIPKIYLNGECVSDYVGVLTIPESVTAIGSYACYGWGITGVIFHDGVTRVGSRAFSKCTALTSLDIPSSVTSVGESFASSCTGLVSAIFAAQTILPRNSYQGCTNLQSVTLGDKVTGFSNFALNGTSFTSITIPTSVNSIAINAFYGSKITLVNFEDTEGWTADGTAISSADLANPTTAATYLTSTYVGKAWTNS